MSKLTYEDKIKIYYKKWSIKIFRSERISYQRL